MSLAFFFVTVWHCIIFICFTEVVSKSSGHFYLENLRGIAVLNYPLDKKCQDIGLKWHNSIKDLHFQAFSK